ncbi:MarR family transcriptional regulator [Catenulispora sp. NF23]|uniref:MarR family transcriptional regulator n=1 Tax=Catenulispora pinistramenti TaxID=2705254 RepID=A0ABS5KZF1_9ACTN|nr:MarR family transcriptional regulator [Catenulispora pinistramenti]MBS2534769.1 MarR family transcriptional regulator [Catenulispora pinistramenti]MBS2551380.1 MarR family transcriptional regulator [Catenulispora pinistramenti]
MSSTLPPRGSDLPLLLLLGFRALIDDVHAELAEAGHAGFRPLHGVTFKAIGDGVTASELGRRLGVSKQAAGKTIEGLEREGYVERVADPEDARSKIIRLTSRGVDVQQQAFKVMADLRARWAERLGEERMAAIEEALREMTADRETRFDIPGWFNG